MKICMLSIADIDRPYGSTARPYFIGKHLARRGVELIHICEKLPEDGPGVRIISRRDYRGTSGAEQARRVRHQCRKFSPDLIYSHQAHSARMGMWLSRSLKRPHIYDAHSSLAHESSTFAHLSLKERFLRIAPEAYLLWRSEKTIVPSAELGDYFVRKYRVRPDRIRVVKNGAETDTFRPADPDFSLRARLGIPPDSFLIVFTNPRLATFPSNEMALRSLFRMIPGIEGMIPGVRFLILGGGPELKGPSPNVIYTGYVKNLPAHLNLADICIAPYPPRAVCGGTRDKVCEYLASGKPIVATGEAMRGFDDALPGEHFLLAADEPDFVEKVVACVRQPDLARRIGQNARRLSEKYDWSHLASKIIDVFQEVGKAWGVR
jgi:glycosyltransferase involved in cell wall biosynthesis